MVSTNQGLPAEAFLLERRLRMVDRKVRGLLILAGLFALTTVIMSLYSISTAHCKQRMIERNEKQYFSA